MTHRLAGQLSAVVDDLRMLYGDYGLCLEVELRAKVDAIRTANSSQMNVGQTDQYVTISTLDATAECLKIKWQIREAEALRDYLTFAIEHDL